MKCVFEPRPVNVIAFLLSNIQTSCARGNTPFYYGGIVTSIALALGLENQLNNMPSMPAEFLDLAYCRNAHLVRQRADGRYNLMIRNQVVPDITLPSPDQMNPQVIENWLFNLNDPENNPAPHEDPNDEPVDEMEQEMDQQHPEQPPSPVQDPSTSNRRRRRPELTPHEEIITAFWQQNQLAAEREAQRQEQHAQLVTMMQQLQQGQANQGQQIDTVIEELGALSMRMNNYEGIPDPAAPRGRGRARTRGRGAQ